MTPSEALKHNRTTVLEAIHRHRAGNPRVFGSVLAGKDHDGSDLDLLIDPQPGMTLFDLGGLQDELEQVMGVSVDLLTPADLPAHFRDQVLSTARPI